MTHASSQTVPQLEPETSVSRLAVPAARPTCRTDSPAGIGTGGEFRSDPDAAPDAPASRNGHLPLPATQQGDTGILPISSAQSPGSASNPPPQPRKLTRNGKIARLPFLKRDMVNRMLRDHVPQDRIVDALTEHGFNVTARNVSNWKTRGGYREWCSEQERALQHRLVQDNLVEHLRK